MRSTFRTKDRPEIAELGRVLKRLRNDAGFSVRELASKLDRGPGFIWKIESGKQSIDLATLIDLAKELGTDAATIVREVEMNCK